MCASNLPLEVVKVVRQILKEVYAKHKYPSALLLCCILASGVSKVQPITSENFSRFEMPTKAGPSRYEKDYDIFTSSFQSDLFSTDKRKSYS
jgi:hypothetical protein